MKIIVKITGKRKSIKKSGFFYTAKDRHDNFFMFNSDESLNNNHYYFIMEWKESQIILVESKSNTIADGNNQIVRSWKIR